MDALRCPICQKQGLFKSQGTAPFKKDRIVCENEFFVHAKIGTIEVLARKRRPLHEIRAQRSFVMSL